MVIAELHLVPGHIVGSTSKFDEKLLEGFTRQKANKGVDRNRDHSDMPHSRPLMRVTWKAALLMKTIAICPASSVEYK